MRIILKCGGKQGAGKRGRERKMYCSYSPVKLMASVKHKTNPNLFIGKVQNHIVRNLTVKVNPSMRKSKSFTFCGKIYFYLLPLIKNEQV